MAAQRRYGRFMGAALVGGPLLVAGVFWASPAQADQTAFLNDLHNAGIHAINGGDPALLQMGAGICQQLSWGASPQQWRPWRCKNPTPTRALVGSTVGRPQTS